MTGEGGNCEREGGATTQTSHQPDARSNTRCSAHFTRNPAYSQLTSFVCGPEFNGAFVLYVQETITLRKVRLGK